MVATYKISATISNTDNAEALATLTYFKDNYSTKIRYVQVVGENKEVHYELEETAYADMITTITALITEFGEVRMPNWYINFSEELIP